MTKEINFDLSYIYNKEDLRDFLLNTHGADVNEMSGLLRVVNSLARGKYELTGNVPTSKRKEGSGNTRMHSRSEIANLLHDPAMYAHAETYDNNVDMFLAILKKKVEALPNVGSNAYRAYLRYVKGQSYEYRNLRLARARQEISTLTTEVQQLATKGALLAVIGTIDYITDF